MTTPNWALSIAYWFHMLATVTWIGGLAVLSLLVLPAARKTLDKQDYANLLEAVRRQLDPLGWFSMMILIGSGMLQLSASPHYEGFLSIHGLWATAILVKHILFGVMVSISGYVTWGIMPKMRRAALLQARGKDAGEMDAIQGRSLRLMRFNLILGIVVLLLTAVARSS
jgi:uncharacterized membrane protein